MSINLNLLRGKITQSKKESLVCEALFYLKQLKFTLLKYFLAYLGSSVKTTNNNIQGKRHEMPPWPPCSHSTQHFP